MPAGTPGGYGGAAGTPGGYSPAFHADTPGMAGTPGLAPTPGGMSYMHPSPAMVAYSPAMAGTPGVAGTPGLAPTPGGPGADPAGSALSSYEHWVDVEVRGWKEGCSPLAVGGCMGRRGSSAVSALSCQWLQSSDGCRCQAWLLNVGGLSRALLPACSLAVQVRLPESGETAVVRSVSPTDGTSMVVVGSPSEGDADTIAYPPDAPTK